MQYSYCFSLSAASVLSVIVPRADVLNILAKTEKTNLERIFDLFSDQIPVNSHDSILTHSVADLFGFLFSTTHVTTETIQAN